MLLILALFLIPVGDDFAYPDGPPGRCAAAYLAAFNSGDESAIRAFEERFRCAEGLKKRPVEDRITQYRELRGEWGKLTPKKQLSAGASELTLLIETGATGDVLRFEFEFEKEPPHGLVAIRIEGPVDAEAHGENVSARPLDAAERKQAVEALCAHLRKTYVFPVKAEEMAAVLEKRLTSGAYDQLDSPSSLAARLTSELQEMSNDKHLRVRTAAPQDQQRSHVPSDSSARNHGFQRLEVLSGNVGYLKLNGFSPTRAAQETAAAALDFLANCDALIFDLRENGGGSPEMIKFLSSYLFEKPTHLNSFFDREGNQVSETWTLETIPGKRFAPDLPVYVLTSSRTFSAAEEFTYNLKCLKRATIVGETTGGGAHPVQMLPAGDRLTVSMPYMRAENPISKTNWEGTGVAPDIATSADKALDAAVADARKRLKGR